MKKILTIFVMMMLVMVGVVSAGSTDYWFTPEGTSEAGVICEEGLGHGGSDCYVGLNIPGSGSIDDNAKFRINASGTLGGLTTFSYWTKVTGTDGELHPYGSINVDTNNDGEADYVIVQWEVEGYPPTGVDTWIQTVWSDATRIHVVDANTGFAITDFTQADAQLGTATLGALKALPGWSGYNVVQVKLAVGMWTVNYPLVGFVDDVNVNGKLYNFEDSNVGGDGADFVALTVPDYIDYGTLYSFNGFKSQTKDITLNNVGTLSVNVNPIFESGAPVFNYINFGDGGSSGVIGAFSTSITAQCSGLPLSCSNQKPLTTWIQLTSSISALKGPQTGKIYFQATEA